MTMGMVFLLSSFFVFHSHALSDSEILVQFKSSLKNATALESWDKNTMPPCIAQTSSPNWVGVVCNKGTIWGLKLEAMGLSGTINVDSLNALPKLTTLSFMNNNFDGPFPNLKKHTELRSIFLSNNKFSGQIPANAFDGMRWIKKIHLSQNQFTGPIPASLATLPKLTDLKLDGNRFSGQIPNFNHPIQTLDLSNNELEGAIPASLAKVDAKFFAGNKGICGGRMKPCESHPAAPKTNSNKDGKKLPIWIIVMLVVVAVLIVVAIVVVVITKRGRDQEASSPSYSSLEAAPSNSNVRGATAKKEQKAGSPGNSRNGRKATEAQPQAQVVVATKLTFVRDDRKRFDLPDLLKSSAEVLGSGSFGSAFKAALSVGIVVVVKRYKQMNNARKEEFLEHMRRIGRLNHENLLPLVAYYYRKEEKLLVSDFVTNGSLAMHLHGHKSLTKSVLDWPTRLKIVKGVAKGLTYLHKELPSLIVPHGHLKSSNVLLNESFEPLLTDYGMIPVINQESAKKLLVSYKSPEYVQQGKITRKSDVWALGILILEILMGMFPGNLKGKKSGEQEDLADWVKSVVGDKETEVFDEEMMGTIKDGDGESMQELLKIGLTCCEEDVDKRLDLKDIVGRIEELN